MHKQQDLADELLEQAIPNGTCLECNLTPNTNGYCKVPNSGNEMAHRFVYKNKKGPIGSLFVLHTCDNKRCINPNHLWLGTAQDNMLDRSLKGRTSHHGRPKAISDEEAEEIVKLRKLGVSYRVIALKYTASEGAVRNAAIRMTNHAK